MSHAVENTVAAKSCLECRRRKIKCDKSIPCSYCVKVKINCRYPAAKSSPNKGETPNPSNEVLSARIDGVENTLQTLEQSISQIWELLRESHPPSSRGQDHDLAPEICLRNGHPSPVDRPSNHTQVGTAFRLPSTASLHSLHPHPTIIFSLWQRFLERVDPVLKLIHTPTVQKEILIVVRDNSHLNLPLHTLFFALYYTSVIAMSAEECWDELRESKDEALKRYKTPAPVVAEVILTAEDFELN